MDAPVYIIVTPFFPSPDNWRGAYCYDFVVALKKIGQYCVEVFVPGKGEDYTIGDIRVHRFAAKQLPSNVLPFLFSRRNQKSFLHAVEMAGINTANIAVCHAHTANFAIYPIAVKARNAKCITLLHHHDLASFGLNLGVLRHCWLYNLMQFPILRKWHEKIDCHVFISEASRKSFLKAPDAGWSVFDDYRKQMRWLPYRPPKIKGSVILHNGIDANIFNAGIRTKNSVFTIGCIGNFIELKDQISLLKAVKLMNCDGVKVVFIGTGPEMERCRAFAKNHGIDAEFGSEVRHEKLPEYYRAIDLFVLPSYFEGFGCVFTESWACGTPFITCEGQGMDDLIPEGERGLWLCKPKSPTDLAVKIKYYIESRPVQHLAAEIDIDKLVPDFVEKIEALREKSL